MAQAPVRPPATRICAACGERFDDLGAFCPRDGAPLVDESGRTPGEPGAPDPRLGVVLPGEIRIDRLVGMGASGRVYRAHQAGVDRDVAVKIMRRPAGGDPRALQRFHREARLASRIVHPHVVTVLLTGELPEAAADAAGEPYAALEWLEGPTLEAVVSAARARGEALDLVRALRIALRVADAAGEAHRAGVVHRDLKPSNVVLVRRGDDVDFVKVLDFGLASLQRPDGGISGGTVEGVVGTARYLAPEAARGAAGPPADVHAVGAMLYESLAGRPPFDGKSAAAVLSARAAREPEDVRSHDRSSYVPAPIAALLARTLARSPERRPGDGAALARDLLHAATSAGLAAEDLLGPRSGVESGRKLRLAAQQRTRPQDPRVATSARTRSRRT